MTTDIPHAGPIRLLALADDAGAVNRMLSTLRQSGLDLRANRVATLPEADALLSGEAPDLLVCFAGAGLALDPVLELLRKHDLSAPLILVTTTHPADASLPALHARGLCRVIDPGQPGELAAAVHWAAEHGFLQRQARQLELALRELQQRHQHLLDHSPLPVAYVRDGVHLYCNDAYTQLFAGSAGNSVCATPLLNLVKAEQRDDLRSLLDRARQSGESATFTAAPVADGEVALRFDFSPVRFDGKSCLQVTVHSAAGNAAHAEAREQAAARDLLTTLDKRSRFFARLEAAIGRAIHEDRTSTLIVLELENFADLVTALGRGTANRILQALAAALPRLITQPFAAGRLDVHSFGILLEESDPDLAMALCRQLEDGLRGGEAGELTASLGLQLSAGLMLVNGNALDAEDLVAKAGVARRRLPAPVVGTRQYHIAESMEAGTGDMLAYLQTALEARRFQPVFQPIVGLGRQERRCYELLIRMLDLDDNEIPPGDFIPLATINGLGEALDRVVTDIAIEALLEAEGSHQLNINITESTLLSHTVLPWLGDRLRETGLAADRLIFDISEVSLHGLQQEALRFCAGLQELGIGLSVSNFGCAVDPTALLEALKPGFVTLDASLVRDLMYSPQDQARVKALIGQLHAMGLEVVIPRVENMATLPLLWELGADYIQGYSVQAPRHTMDFEFVQDQEITLTAPGTGAEPGTSPGTSSGTGSGTSPGTSPGTKGTDLQAG